MVDILVIVGAESGSKLPFTGTPSPSIHISIIISRGSVKSRPCSVRKPASTQGIANQLPEQTDSSDVIRRESWRAHHLHKIH